MHVRERKLAVPPFDYSDTHIQNKKKWPENCRVCLVLKHLGPYFVQMFVHIFALYVGARGSLARFCI